MEDLQYFAIQHVGDNKYEMGTKAVEIDENVPQDYGHLL